MRDINETLEWLREQICEEQKAVNKTSSDTMFIRAVSHKTRLVAFQDAIDFITERIDINDPINS